MEIYDVVIVGAGPAGLFAALVLAKTDLKVALIDKGPSLDNRITNRNSAGLSGFGGSGGGINDGKLIFSSVTGGRLDEYLDSEKLNNYLENTKEIWLNFIRDIEIDNFTNLKNKDLVEKAAVYGWELIVSDTIHIGSDLLPMVLKNIEQYLIQKHVDITMDCGIQSIIPPQKDIPGYLGLKTDYFKLGNGNKFLQAKNVILAPGRGGAKWLQEQCFKLGIQTEVGMVDIGVRVEVPFEVTQHLTDAIYEFKLKYITPSYQDTVRTFCCNPRGIVVKEEHNNFTLVNGYSNKDKNSLNTNFAFLSSIKLTEPTSNPLEFSEHIAHTVNSIAQGVMVQKFGDLINYKRTKSLGGNKVKPTLECYCGDLGLALPHRFTSNIIEGLLSLDNIAPGVADDSTLLYAPENKLYSSVVKVDNNMRTDIKGLYVIGDGGGLTRGLVHSSISGMIAANHVISL